LAIIQTTQKYEIPFSILLLLFSYTTGTYVMDVVNMPTLLDLPSYGH